MSVDCGHGSAPEWCTTCATQELKELRATAVIAAEQRLLIGSLRRDLAESRERSVVLTEALDKLWRSAVVLGEQLPAEVQPQWAWSSIGDAIRAARTVLDRHANVGAVDLRAERDVALARAEKAEAMQGNLDGLTRALNQALARAERAEGMQRKYGWGYGWCGSEDLGNCVAEPPQENACSGCMHRRRLARIRVLEDALRQISIGCDAAMAVGAGNAANEIEHLSNIALVALADPGRTTK